MFKFKQFSVDQTNCAMKINTDGVLLGALAEGKDPDCILDIGTGTGVIALMLAQRFNHACIDAIEIDKLAASTAAANFKNSIFNERLAVFPIGFKEFFERYPNNKYDLIVSNPPFYINALLSPVEKKQIAKHADQAFFEDMMAMILKYLSESGTCWFVLPLNTAELIKLVGARLGLNVMKIIRVKSFADREPHREIVVLSRVKFDKKDEQFVIYEKANIHSDAYKRVLSNYFLNF